MKILIGLGGNLGERAQKLAEAASFLENVVDVTARSGIYESEPWGYLDQPRFLNAVIQAETDLEPLRILDLLKEYEIKAGRQELFRFGPRIIDLDLLSYGDWVFQSCRLTLPHPRMHERLFVLQPLCDFDPQWCHPVLGKTASVLRDALLKDTPNAVHPWQG
jgi:2-amino-4-hydroxy-6-hydroxymethyldihydropteridine diphosphokinase